MTEESKALARVEVGTDIERVVGEAYHLTEVEVTQQAGLLKAQWGKSLELEEEDWKALVTLSTACGMNPVFDLDVMGGQLYDKSDFWKGLVAGHPNVEDTIGPVRIEFGSPEWDQWVCISDPTVVAAAYWVSVKMAGRRTPQVAGQYVKKDDPMLWIVEPFDDGQSFGKGPDAKPNARKYAGPHGKVHWITPKDSKPWLPEGWLGRKGKLAPDWEGLAAKKCQTTVFRRVGKMTIPLAHAKVLQFMDRVGQMAELAEQNGPASVPETPEDPFAEQAERPVVGTTGSSTISEKDRKTMMAIASAKGLTLTDVKGIYRKVRSIPTEQEVHLSELTYDDMKEVVSVIDELPHQDPEIVPDSPAAPEPEPAAAPARGDGAPDLWEGGPEPE